MNRALSLAFVLVISLPLAANLAGVDGGDSHAENRELAAMPALDGSVTSVLRFPAGFSSWFEDHFGFRSMLVRWYGETRLFGLGVSPTTAVVNGRGGWLFYADDAGMDDYSNVTPLAPGWRMAWKDTIVRASEWLRARGIAYVFTIAPDKHVLYPDEMPASIRRVRDESRTDEVFGVLGGTGAPAVDVRARLRDARERERIFQKTDTHWNDRGAFVAYEQIIAVVRAQCPAVPAAWSRDDFTATEVVEEAGDLAGMMGLRRVLREVDLRLTPVRPRLARVVDPPGAQASDELGQVITEIPGSTLPRAVIFRDSFASALAPFLSEHFSRAVYLWQNDFDASVVEKEHADVVIQEIVGRHLYEFVPSPELVPK